MSKVGDAFVEIGAKDVNFTKGMDKAGNKLAKFGARTTAASGKFTHSIAQMRVALGLLKFAIAGLVAGGALKNVLGAFREQEKQTAKINAVLKATGNAAGFSSRELQDMASSLQAATGVGDEMILSLQAIVGTFKGIKGEQFEKVTENVLDLAVVLDTDAKSAAIQLGKALNDPIKGITALSRAGIQFTEVQKEQIQNLVKTNQLMKAQNVILKEVEGQVGGTARAMRDTFGGSVDAVNNSFGDMKEGLGELIVEFFNLEEANNDIAAAFTNTEQSLKTLANNPSLIAFSERLRASFAKGILEVQLMAENVTLAGRVIGRALKNLFTTDDAAVGDLVSKKMEENQRRRDSFDEIFKSRLTERLKKNTDQMIAEEEKGAGKVVEAEAQKRKARNSSLASFADIIKEAQKAANLGSGIAAPGAVGGGAQAANPPGTRPGDRIATTTDERATILKQMLAQLKLIVTGVNNFAVFA